MKQLQFFSKYKPLSYNRAIPVAIHNGIWHQLANPKNPTLGEPYPVVHKHDLAEQVEKGKSVPNSEDDIHEDIQKALDQSIRQSPIALNTVILPRIGLLLELWEMSATMTTPAEIVGYIKTPVSQERVKQVYKKAMKKYKPLEGTGPLGGNGMPLSRGGGPTGPRGPSGGGENLNPPAGGNLAGGGQLPSDKMWGSLWNHFDGTRSKADDFIDELKSYFCVNRLNVALQFPITKAAFTLTLIKGPEVTGWVRDTGEFLDNLDPTTNDVPEVWEQFLNNFAERFQDSTCENRAWQELENLTLKFPFIDKYTSKFEELAQQANYMARNPETWQIFLKGLPCNILEDIIKARVPPTYQDLKQWTVDAVWAHQTIDNILKWRSTMTSAPLAPFHPNNYRGWPFYWGN
jgi:retrotransposon gag protein